VGSLRQVLAWTLVAFGMLVFPPVAPGQVGIPSGVAQVTLVAHVVTRASVQGVSGERVMGRVGGLRETSTTVRISANTGYRLIIRRAGAPSSRVWVRAVTGEFQELTDGSSVTVAQGAYGAVAWEREIQYRIEAAGMEESLPVRYEMAISPQL
jgi:hypothetical protein